MNKYEKQMFSTEKDIKQENFLCDTVETFIQLIFEF